MLARDDDGCRQSFVRREDGGCGGRRIRKQQGEIEWTVATLLDSRADAGGAEAPRRRHTTRPDRHGGDHDIDAGWSPASRVCSIDRPCTSSSGTTIAYCPHCRNCEHVWQSVKIFSSSHECGTIEKPMP